MEQIDKKKWILRRWKVLPPKKLAEALRRYWGGRDIVEHAKEIFQTDKLPLDKGF